MSAVRDEMHDLVQVHIGFLKFGMFVRHSLQSLHDVDVTDLKRCWKSESAHIPTTVFTHHTV